MVLCVCSICRKLSTRHPSGIATTGREVSYTTRKRHEENDRRNAANPPNRTQRQRRQQGPPKPTERARQAKELAKEQTKSMLIEF
jgi:hypothetical protein